MAIRRSYTLYEHRLNIVWYTFTRKGSPYSSCNGVVLSVLLAVYLKEPLYPDTTVKGMMIIFAAVGVAFPGLLGLLIVIYKSVSWMLNIHAPIEAMCIMAAFTSFIALKNGIVSVSIINCMELTESSNSTNCICKNLVTGISCEELAAQQTRSSAIFGVFVCALILLVVDIILSSRKLCCTDEIPEIPGIIEKEENTNENKDGKMRMPKVDKMSNKYEISDSMKKFSRGRMNNNTDKMKQFHVGPQFESKA